jgi:HEAT repeat protein
MDLEMLLANLQHPDPWQRTWAAQQLAGCEPSSADIIVPLLVNALQDPEAYVRAMAAQSLGKIHAHAEVCVPALLPCLQDPSEDVRQTSVLALTNFGPAAHSAISALTALLKDGQSAEEKRYAAQALWKIGSLPEESVLALIQATGDEDGHVRNFAVLALGAHGQLYAEQVVPCLMHATTDSYDVVRSSSYRALTQRGPKAKLAVPLLIRYLKEKDNELPMVIDALGEMGPAAAAAIPALSEISEHANEDHRRIQATEALRKIQAGNTAGRP